MGPVRWRLRTLSFVESAVISRWKNTLMTAYPTEAKKMLEGGARIVAAFVVSAESMLW